MHALQLLREMHSDAKTQFRVILATEDAGEADRLWHALQPILALHERLEDEFVYTPVAQECGPGTPLGDWDDRHESDVTVVNQLIAEVDRLPQGSPQWRMQIGRVADALMRHVTDEEGQIFGRVAQFWGDERLEAVGKAMKKAKDSATREAVGAGTKPARRGGRG